MNLSIIELEKRRFQRKGYQGFLGVLILISFIYYIPIIGKSLWFQYIIQIEDRQTFYILFMTFWHSFCVILAFGFYMPLYIFKIPFLEKMRCQPKNKWPWENKETWPTLKKRLILTISFIHLIFFPFLLFMDTKIGLTVRFDIESFPSRIELFSQIAMAILFEDFLFFWSHYALHIPFLYKLIHKKHHEFTSTISIAAEYSNLGEYFFGNIIPASIAFKILRGRAHFFTVIVWTFVRIAITAEAHSGYELNFSPLRIFPMSGGGEFHGFHHKQNEGAYGSFFTFWDYITKSDKQYYKYREDKYNQSINLKQN